MTEVGVVASGGIGIEDQRLEQPHHMLPRGWTARGIEVMKVDRKAHKDPSCHQWRTGGGDEQPPRPGPLMNESAES